MYCQCDYNCSLQRIVGSLYCKEIKGGIILAYREESGMKEQQGNRVPVLEYPFDFERYIAEQLRESASASTILFRTKETKEQKTSNVGKSKLLDFSTKPCFIQLYRW